MNNITNIIFSSTGTILATLLSYRINNDIIWAIVHGFCSWFYIVYWIIFKS